MAKKCFVTVVVFIFLLFFLIFLQKEQTVWQLDRLKSQRVSISMAACSCYWESVLFCPIYIHTGPKSSSSEQSVTGGGHSCRLIGSAVTWLQLCGVRCTGSCHHGRQQVLVNEGLPAAKQTGAAGADATDGGQVGMMEDRQLHGQTAPHAERNHRKEVKLQKLQTPTTLMN